MITRVKQFGRLWYGEPNAIANAVDYAKFYSRSHDKPRPDIQYGGSVRLECTHTFTKFAPVKINAASI